MQAADQVKQAGQLVAQQLQRAKDKQRLSQAEIDTISQTIGYRDFDDLTKVWKAYQL